MFDAIRAAIEGAFANWTTTRIAWANVAFDPAGITAPWILVQSFPSGSDRITMTGVPSTGHRFTGSLVVDIYLPVGSGLGAGASIADSLATKFREKTLAVSGTTQHLQFGSSVSVSESGGGETWTQVTFSVGWVLQT